MVVRPVHIGRLLCSIGATSRSIFTNGDMYMYTQYTGQVSCTHAGDAWSVKSNVGMQIMGRLWL